MTPPVRACSCCQLAGFTGPRGKLLLLQMATPAVDWAESPSVFRCLQEETGILAATVFVESQLSEGGNDSTGIQTGFVSQHGF